MSNLKVAGESKFIYVCLGSGISLAQVVNAIENDQFGVEMYQTRDRDAQTHDVIVIKKKEKE